MSRARWRGSFGLLVPAPDVDLPQPAAALRQATPAGARRASCDRRRAEAILWADWGAMHEAWSSSVHGPGRSRRGPDTVVGHSPRFPSSGVIPCPAAVRRASPLPAASFSQPPPPRRPCRPGISLPPRFGPRGRRGPMMRSASPVSASAARGRATRPTPAGRGRWWPSPMSIRTSSSGPRGPSRGRRPTPTSARCSRRCGRRSTPSPSAPPTTPTSWLP